MIYYLLDTSVVIEFYKPKATYRTFKDLRRSLEIRAYITKQKEGKKATLFVPSFCVAEVQNTLAKWYLRYKNVFRSENHYKSILGRFIYHIHDRNFFYSYDLNRYHNLNTGEVVPVEHTTDTEFDVSGLPVETPAEEINAKLKEIDRYDNINKHYLSTLDILIITMGIELKRITGEEVYLLTGDKRLALISSQKPDEFPKPLYWKEIKVSDLPK